MSLDAQTNDINLFYSQTWAAAWEDTGKPYYNSKGHISFPNDNVLLARLEIFNHFFMPHPFDCYYEDLLLEKETKIIDLTVDLEAEKKKSIRRFLAGVGIGAGAVLVPVLWVSAGNR